MARGSLSFLERSPRVIGGIGLTFLLGATVLGLLLQGGVLTATYGVSAVFSDAAGIRPDDRVTVAGLPAGRVAGLRLEDGSVVVDLAVNEGVEVPADSGAEVVIETFLGRRSVALHPGDSPQPLEDGSVIPLERTITPVDVTDLNDISVDLLQASDAEAFEQFLADVADITEGKARAIQTTIRGLEDVTRAVDSRRQQLRGLLRSLRILAETFGQRDQRIVSLIDNLGAVMANLAERSGQLQRLLEATDSSSHETADLVRRNRAVLDSALANLHTDLQVLDRHQVDLAATITYLEQSVQGYSSVGYTRGVPNRWANIFVQSLGPLGVDNLVGKCGVVDRLFDELFGADCKESSGASAPAARDGDMGGAASPGTDQDTTEAVQPATPEPSLPCTTDDLVDSVLEGTDALPAEPGGCRG